MIRQKLFVFFFIFTVVILFIFGGCTKTPSRKVVRIIINQSYGAAKDVSLPFEKNTRNFEICRI